MYLFEKYTTLIHMSTLIPKHNALMAKVTFRPSDLTFTSVPSQSSPPLQLSLGFKCQPWNPSSSRAAFHHRYSLEQPFRKYARFRSQRRYTFDANNIQCNESCVIIAAFIRHLAHLLSSYPYASVSLPIDQRIAAFVPASGVIRNI